ncbi:MAG TPA: hypothetical protein DD426_03490 [Clostridiaceae bacterium]|nr:hypothetical protein [Clostridiaceae bacterium]
METSLHSSIKRWYARPGDRLEAMMEGYIIDILRDDLLIEIQTKNFSAISRKLYKLLKSHRIRLVYPIPKEKYIVKISPYDGSILSRRKSPKHGRLIDIFDELIRIPAIINEDNFMFEALFIKEEDITCQDGKGSWRRRGISIVDRKLTDVFESVQFACKDDFYIFLPDNLSYPFTNKDYARCFGCTISKARKVTYCLKKMGIIAEKGRIRDGILYCVK